MEIPEPTNQIHKITSQDLLSKAAPPRIVRPPGYFRELILDSLAILLAGTTGLLASLYVVGSVPLWVLLTGFVLWLSVSVSLTAATRSFGRRMLIFLAEGAALLALAWIVSTEYFGIAAFLVLALGMWGVQISRSEFRNSLNLRFIRSARPQIGRSVTVFVLLILILLVPRNISRGEYLSDTVFRSVFGFAVSSAEELYPEIRMNQTVGVLVEDLARYNLAKEGYFRQLPEDIQQELLNKASIQVLEDLSKISGQSLKPDTPTQAVLRNLVYGGLGSLRISFGDWFDIAWVILSFAIFRGLAIILGWIAGFVAFLVNQLLVATGVLVVRGEAQVQEVTVFG